MSFNHVFLAHKHTPNGIRLEDVDEFDDSYLVSDGDSASDEFPTNAQMRMNSDRKENTVLGDTLSNLDSFIVASTKLRDIISTAQAEEIEYLPVRILDHLGQEMSASYCIVNPLGTHDILDVEACGVKWGLMDSIDQYAQFVVDPEKCKDLPSVFRIKHFSNYILVHKTLAKTISDAELQGVGFVDPKQLEGKPLPATLFGKPLSEVCQ